MIISHRHRFIFVKTSKTAGTSIEIFLSQHCGPDDVVTPFGRPEPGHEPRNHLGLFNQIPEIIPAFRHGRATARPAGVIRQFVGRRKFYNHMPAWQAVSRLGARRWREYFTFCFDRNPWDKTLSHFHMLKQRGVVDDLDGYFRHASFPTDRWRYTDHDGRLMVDKVYRYEDLRAAMDEICGRFGVPFDGDLGARAKGAIRTDRAGYREVMTDSHRQTVARVFRDEIEHLGYEW